MRQAGVLMPLFSLPGRFGIGDLGSEAYAFVDFLEKSGQDVWQILPVGPTGFGNSPYQPVSSFAGNPYFISPEKLIEEGFLTWDEANSFSFGQDEQRVDYGALYENRYPLLRIAFGRFADKLSAAKSEYDRCESEIKDRSEEEKKTVREQRYKDNLYVKYEDFLKREKYWAEDFALFMALKDHFGGSCWQDWDEPYKCRDEKVLDMTRVELKDSVDFYLFQQFEFDRQWKALHEYAAAHNIEIIGDIPFYVAFDSADAWSHPEAFCMDSENVPTVVAGCPPDAFSATGQLWGNPIYDWAALKENHYDWWISRMKRNTELFDVIRIDHFHGFCDYYAIPYGDKTAEHGTMEKGPGMDFFRVLKKKLPDTRIIAEDLGNNTPENEKLLKDTGFPGMKVLQYAFTSWNEDSYYITHRHIPNCVVYTGTHDNTTARAWIEEINDHDRDYARRYCNSMNTDYGAFVWDFIREAHRSVANLCVIPLQDYLVLGKEARINLPGSVDGNWQWRLKAHFLSDDLALSMRKLAETYGRYHNYG